MSLKLVHVGLRPRTVMDPVSRLPVDTCVSRMCRWVLGTHRRAPGLPAPCVLVPPDRVGPAGRWTLGSVPLPSLCPQCSRVVEEHAAPLSLDL